MKIQIIQLDRHDDVLSIRDKISWAKSPRILLIWPEQSKINLRRIDLMVLQRKGSQVGAQIGLVTHDAEVIASANDAGIPVFKTISHAQRSYWKHNRKPDPVPVDLQPPRDLRRLRPTLRDPLYFTWLENRWIQFAIFTFAVICILVLTAAFIPSAKIEIAPPAQTQSVVIPVIASDQIKAINLTGNLPAHPISVVVEGQDHIQTTGKISIPDQKAYGIAMFTNLTDQSVEIPIGTVIRTIGTPEIRFATTDVGKVNPGSGNITNIPVQAILPGEDSDLPSFSLVAIEGPLGLQLSVANVSGIYNGTSKLSLAPSQGDYNQLHDRLVKSLQQAALKQMLQNLQMDDQLIPAELTLKNTLNETRSPEIGSPSDALNLSLRLEFSALVASGEDLRALASAALDANLTKGSLPVKGSLKIVPLGPPVIQDASAHWQIKVERQVVTNLSKDQIISNSMGLTPKAASSKLTKQYGLKSLPLIQIQPAWWPRLPFFPFLISVNLTGI